MDDDGADRASQEIKALLKRLDPNKSSHKDRIRRLNKFRNFVTGVSESLCLCWPVTMYVLAAVKSVSQFGWI